MVGGAYFGLCFCFIQAVLQLPGLNLNSFHRFYWEIQKFWVMLGNQIVLSSLRPHIVQVRICRLSKYCKSMPLQPSDIRNVQSINLPSMYEYSWVSIKPAIQNVLAPSYFSGLHRIEFYEWNSPWEYCASISFMIICWMTPQQTCLLSISNDINLFDACLLRVSNPGQKSVFVDRFY